MAFSLKNYTDLGYTRDAIVKQLLLIQNHSQDGSVTDAKCMCVEDKHLILLEGLAEEGMSIASNKKEKEFYSQLAGLTRQLRKSIVNEDFTMHGVMRKVQAKHGVKVPKRKNNPIRFTKCEVEHPKIMAKLERCVLKVKKTSPDVNPYAVCRTSIKCPP